MTVRTIAAALGLAGGLVWVLAGALGWGESPVTGPAATLATFGVLVLAAAGSFGGYCLVPTAPVWLRAVVTLGAGALVALVAISIAPGLEFPGSLLLGVGVLLLLIGGLSLRASRPAAEAVTG